MPRKPIGETAMTDAERQARYRAARATGVPVVRVHRPADHRGRARRWTDHVAGLVQAQAEYAAWLENLPDSLQDGTTAEALQTICDLDLSELQAIIPPRGFGRTDYPPLRLIPAMHRDLPRPPLRATPQALRYGRGSLLCIAGISPNQRQKGVAIGSEKGVGIGRDLTVEPLSRLLTRRGFPATLLLFSLHKHGSARFWQSNEGLVTTAHAAGTALSAQVGGGA